MNELEKQNKRLIILGYIASMSPIYGIILSFFCVLTHTPIPGDWFGLGLVRKIGAIFISFTLAGGLVGLFAHMTKPSKYSVRAIIWGLLAVILLIPYLYLLGLQ